MIDAPEQIWVEPVPMPGPKGYVSGVWSNKKSISRTLYTRTDIHDSLKAENEWLRELMIVPIK